MVMANTNHLYMIHFMYIIHTNHSMTVFDYAIGHYHWSSECTGRIDCYSAYVSHRSLPLRGTSFVFSFTTSLLLIVITMLEFGARLILRQVRL